MIKLVISDMDGTLIGKDEKLSLSIIAMAQKLKEQGILFTIATGRVESMAYEYVEQLGINIPYIACNGATIMDGTKTVMRNSIVAAPLKEIIGKARTMGMSIIYTILGKEFVFDATPWVLRQRQEFNRYFDEHILSEDEWENTLLDKITIMDEIRDGRICKIERMCQQFNGTYFFTRYTNKAIEIVDKDSNKSTAAVKIAKLLGIDMKEIMSIGDHENDVELLKEAGLGVAVANATDNAKAAADYVSQLECYEGVLEAVDRFCLSKGEAT